MPNLPANTFQCLTSRAQARRIYAVAERSWRDGCRRRRSDSAARNCEGRRRCLQRRVRHGRGGDALAYVIGNIHSSTQSQSFAKNKSKSFRALSALFGRTIRAMVADAIIDQTSNSMPNQAQLRGAGDSVPLTNTNGAYSKLPRIRCPNSLQTLSMPNVES